MVSPLTPWLSAVRKVRLPRWCPSLTHTGLHAYPLSKCFLSSYMEVTLQEPPSSSSSADLAPPCRALLGHAALPASPTKSPALAFAGDTERKCKPETHKGGAPGWYLGKEL